MDQSRVFIGLYVDNHESIFYRKSKNLYYDMKAKKDVSFTDLQLTSLVLYSDIISGNYHSREKMIRLYDLDRMKKVHLNRVFLGKIYQLDDVTISTNFIQGEDRIEVSESKVSSISLKKEHALLYANSNQELVPDFVYDDFIDLETGRVYTHKIDFVNGTQFVSRLKKNMIPIQTVFDIEKDSIEKIKLLDKYRQEKYRI